jgi:NAD(P)-dependent dehydrogenase (short-subunit alcohol dehydrogenase family)
LISPPLENRVQVCNGRIDGFFNNAGIEGKQNLTEDFGSDEFQKVISVNLNGVFYGLN